MRGQSGVPRAHSHSLWSQPAQPLLQPCLSYVYEILLAGQREGAVAVLLGMNSLPLFRPSAVPFQPTVPIFSIVYDTLDSFVEAIDAGGTVEVDVPHLVDGSGPGACGV